MQLSSIYNLRGIIMGIKHLSPIEHDALIVPIVVMDLTTESGVYFSITLSQKDFDSYQVWEGKLLEPATDYHPAFYSKTNGVMRGLKIGDSFAYIHR